MTTREALFCSVLACPVDDLPRLVLADFLDESGDGADAIRARFIRRQFAGDAAANVPLTVLTELEPFTGGRQPHQYGTNISRKGVAEVTYGETTFEYRRGFLHTVRCTLADWLGSRCECVPGDSPCDHCHGVRTVGIGAAVVARHPVTTIRFTDVIAVQRRGTGKFEIAIPYPYTLHFDMALVAGGQFDSEQQALDALSNRLIAWAKSQPHPARIVATPVSVDFVTG